MGVGGLPCGGVSNGGIESIGVFWMMHVKLDTEHKECRAELIQVVQLYSLHSGI